MTVGDFHESCDWAVLRKAKGLLFSGFAVSSKPSYANIITNNRL